MRFLKGSLTYTDLQKMPIDEIFDLNQLSSRLSKQESKGSK